MKKLVFMVTALVAFVLSSSWAQIGGSRSYWLRIDPACLTVGCGYEGEVCIQGVTIHTCNTGTELFEVQGGGGLTEDSVGTFELDDGVDAPGVGECVIVASGELTFEYGSCGGIPSGIQVSDTTLTTRGDVRISATADGLYWYDTAERAAVAGAASSLDNEIARFDLTTGKLIQSYTSGGPTVSDTGVGAFNASLSVSDTLITGRLGPESGAASGGAIRIVDCVTFACTKAGIQAAIDDMPTAGGTVVLPSQTIDLATGLSITNVNTRLVGQGRGTVLRATAVITMLTVDGSTTANVGNVIDSIHFDLNSTASTAISFINGNSAIARGIHVTNPTTGSFGIKTSGGAHETVIRDFDWWHNADVGTAISIDTNNCLIEDFSIVDALVGIDIAPASAISPIVIRHGRILSVGTGIRIDDFAVLGVFVHDMRFEDNATYDIDFRGFDATTNRIWGISIKDVYTSKGANWRIGKAASVSIENIIFKEWTVTGPAIVDGGDVSRIKVTNIVGNNQTTTTPLLPSTWSTSSDANMFSEATVFFDSLEIPESDTALANRGQVRVPTATDGFLWRDSAERRATADDHVHGGGAGDGDAVPEANITFATNDGSRHDHHGDDVAAGVLADARLPSELAYEDEANIFDGPGIQSFIDFIQLEAGADLVLEDPDGTNTISFDTLNRTTNILLSWDIATITACSGLGDGGKLTINSSGEIGCAVDANTGGSAVWTEETTAILRPATTTEEWVRLSGKSTTERSPAIGSLDDVSIDFDFGGGDTLASNLNISVAEGADPDVFTFEGQHATDDMVFEFTASGTGASELRADTFSTLATTAGQLTLFENAGSEFIRHTVPASITTSKTFTWYEGTTVGVVHEDGSGVLSSSLIVNADVDASAAITEGKILYAATGHEHTGTTDGNILPAGAYEALSIVTGDIALETLLTDKLDTDGGNPPALNDCVTVDSADTTQFDFIPCSGGFTNWLLGGDSGPAQTISNGDTALILGGINISTAASATDTLTVDIDLTDITDSQVLYDNSDAIGGISQFTYDGTNLTLSPTSGDDIAAEELVDEVYNNSGATIFKCSAVYISGFNVGADLPEVDVADNDAGGAMPAIGIVRSDITTASAGFIVEAGDLFNADTTTGESWSAGDPVYVNASGTSTSSDCGDTLTNVKPTGGSNLIQKIGTIARVNPANGVIEISGAGRTNDVPNAITISTDDTINTDIVGLDNSWDVVQGGTGLTSGTDGGLVYFDGTTSMASTALMDLNEIMLGGGASAAPSSTVTGGLGTTIQVLHGNAGGAPAWGSVVNDDIATDTIDTDKLKRGGNDPAVNDCVTVNSGDATEFDFIPCPGGGGTLDDAYELGRTINVDTALPVELVGVDSTLDIRASADTDPALRFDEDGVMQWGSGAAVFDVQLSRTDVSELSFEAGDTLKVDTVAGTSTGDVAIADSTPTNLFLFEVEEIAGSRDLEIVSGSLDLLLASEAVIWRDAEGETLTLTAAGLAGNRAVTFGNFAGEISILAQLIENAEHADMASQTVKVNATGGAAIPTDLAVGTNVVVGRVGGNIVAAQLVAAQAESAFVIDTEVPSASGNIEGTFAAGLTIQSKELDGNDIADGLAGLHLTFNTTPDPDVIDLDSEIFTRVKTWNLFDPATGDSDLIQWTEHTAITIVRIWCSTDVATSTVTIMPDERTEALPNTQGVDILSAGLVCDFGTRTTCGSSHPSQPCDVDTISNGAIDAYDPVSFDIDAIANSPTFVRVHVEYTVDD